MRTGSVLEILKICIANNFPVLLTGSPGIGKTDLVLAAAKSLGAEIILSHPVVSDQTDAKGLPFVSEDKKSAVFLPFGDLSLALSATEKTVWCLDDLGQATPAVQASFMQLLLSRSINGHRLSDLVTFVACTNRRTDRAGVTGILEPVKSRFTTIIEVEANLEDWCSWALDSNIPAELVAFLRYRPDLLSAFKATADLTQSPSPRTWANAAKFLNCGLSRELELDVLSGAVGQGTATEFLGFLQVYRHLPDLDGILANPKKATIPKNVDAKYATVTGLAYKATAQNFGAIVEYAKMLEIAKSGEFAVLLLRDTVRRCPDVCDTDVFLALVNTKLGKLINNE
jgi:hypothetical protein